MLNEFLARQRAIPEAQSVMTNQERYVAETVQAFDRTVDFLRAPSFPNSEINRVVTLLWRSIGNNKNPQIPKSERDRITTALALDPQGTLPSIYFAVGARRDNPAETTGTFLLPLNFIDLVRRDPLMQLGAIVYSASKARDYYTGRIRSGNVDPNLEDRAHAFEAEALLTALQMAQAEGQQLTLNEYQQEVLRRFPQGLASLPEGVNYETPEWDYTPSQQTQTEAAQQAQATAEVGPQMLKEARDRFNRAVARIKNSKVEGISEMAERLEARITAGEIPVVYEQGADRPMVTEVRLHNIGSENQIQYVPTVVINVAKILRGSMKVSTIQDALAGDLVRTLSVAEKVPLNGYQARKQDIYREAIEAERKWLEEKNVATLSLNDPRRTNTDEMLLNLLGEASYYTDTGWDDFTAALEAYRQQLGLSQQELADINSMLQNPAHFVAMRERLTPMMHQVASQQMGDAYRIMSSERRAEAAAYNLLGMSLYARDNSSLN